MSDEQGPLIRGERRIPRSRRVPYSIPTSSTCWARIPDASLAELMAWIKSDGCPLTQADGASAKRIDRTRHRSCASSTSYRYVNGTVRKPDARAVVPSRLAPARRADGWVTHSQHRRARGLRSGRARWRPNPTADMLRHAGTADHTQRSERFGRAPPDIGRLSTMFLIVRRMVSARPYGPVTGLLTRAPAPIQSSARMQQSAFALDSRERVGSTASRTRRGRRADGDRDTYAPVV